MKTMALLLLREFVVDIPRAAAWRHLAQVERWPTWARHINSVDLIPPGELNAKSIGVFRLGKFVKSSFRMSQWNPPTNWVWVGGFLWLTIRYDHAFEQIGAQKTKLTWIVEASGFGVSVLGKFFAKIYKKNLDKAIPLLIAEMNATDASNALQPAAAPLA